MADIEKLAGQLFDRFTAHVDKALAPLRAKLAEIEARQPEKGEKGDPGEPGLPGEDGMPGVQGSPGAEGPPGPAPSEEQIAAAAAQYLAANPPAAGEPGAKGADGVGVASGLIDRAGHLILTLTNGETKDLGCVIGKDGQDAEPVKQEAVAELVRDFVAKAIEPLKAAGPGVDPAALQSMVDKAAADAVAALPPAAPGTPGRDADPEVVAKMVADAIAALPKAQDGKSVSVEDVTPVLADLVAKAVAALPPAPAGKDADMAEINRRIDEGIAKAMAGVRVPEDGKSVDPAEVERLVSERVERAVAALPKPAAGRDGLDAVEFLRNEKGHLVCTMSDGSIKDLGPINGADGFGFDDLQAEYDGDRRLVVRFVQGERVKEFEAVLPVIIDRGVYSPGKSYERGDAISFGGALWVCQTEKSAEKPGTNTDWRLAVKKGRDGRDGTGRPGTRA